MNRLALATLLAVGLAGCELGKSTDRESAAAQCLPVDSACASNDQCCSYGCVLGTCQPNDVIGGVCRTTDDCGFQLTCQGGACVAGGICRAQSDSCTFDSQCCTGNCLAGSCQPNRAPVLDLGGDGEIPSRRPFAFQPSGTSGPNLRVYTVSDPDGDPLVYGWTLVAQPAGSTAALSSRTVASPSFTPDLAGSYVVQLSVTDGSGSLPQRQTTTQTITLTAVNFAPAATTTSNVTTASRNFTTVNLGGSVSDANGDAITCTWKKTSPAAGATPVVIAGPVACAGGSGTAASFVPDVEGVWTLTLEASDGAATTTATVEVTCVNDAPVASAGADRAGNEGPTPSTAEVVPLRGTATDKNGDPLTYAWTVVSAPGGSGFSAGDPVGNAADASFRPTIRGDYVLNLHVEDGAGGADDDTVLVRVDRRVRPLGRIVAAERLGRLAAESDRLVLVGVDPSSATAYRLWVLDPRSEAAPVEVVLSAEPTCLGLSSDGTVALVGQKGSHWQRVTGLDTATPVASPLYNAPYDPTSIAWISANRFVAGGTVSGGTSSAVYDLDVSTATNYAASTCQSGLVACTSAAVRGTRVVAWTDASTAKGFVAVLDETGDTLRRYEVRPNGTLQLEHQVTAGLALADGLWLSSDEKTLYLSTGAAYATGTLGPQTGLGLSIEFVDTRGTGAAFRGLATGASSFVAFDPSVNTLSTDAPPVWGIAGGPFQTTPRFGFLSTDASVRWVVVQAASAPGAPYGVAVFP